MPKTIKGPITMGSDASKEDKVKLLEAVGGLSGRTESKGDDDDI